MKYPSKRDSFYSIVIFLTALLTLIPNALAMMEGAYWSILATVPIVILLMWIYFGTYYELRETYLFAKSGPFFEKIRYSSIIEISKCKNLLSSMALSRNRIKIQTSKGPVFGVTYISPIDLDEFYALLLIEIKNNKESKNP